jgi:diguanylate cyclase (GGDEF)-like protein
MPGRALPPTGGRLARRTLALAACLVALVMGNLPRPVTAAGVRTLQQEGAVDIAKKSALILVLGGFGSNDTRPLQDGIKPVEVPAGGDRTQELAQLTAIDTQGGQILGQLQAAVPTLGHEIVDALTPLSAADKSALQTGGTISVPPGPMLGALDDLLLHGGAGSASRPDPPSDVTALQAALALSPPPTAAPATPPPTATPKPTTGPSSSGVTTVEIPTRTVPLPILAGSTVLGIVLVATVVYLLLRQRRLKALAATAAATAPTTHAPAPEAATVPSELVDAVLEVSRRLTMITAVDEIERAIVREAMGGVPSDMGALVVRQGKRLAIAYETRTDVLIADRLEEGVIGRVAATGQPIYQVSASEPAIRNLPVAIMLVPLVGGGTVEGVLILMRDAQSPYTPDEQRRITAVAPVAAAAMHSARETTAAVEESRVDPLTGVGNRRRLETELAEVLETADGRPTAVIMLDLDHFKAVNDTHGHAAGDAVLKAAAAVMRRTVRPADAVYRYGGEEFCVVCPETTGAEAMEIAQRIREAIAAQPFTIGSTVLQKTASLGVAAGVGNDGPALIREADAALYVAKESGRNRVELSGAAQPG